MDYFREHALLDYFAAIDRGERELPPPAIDPRYLPRAEEPMETHS